MRGVGRTGWDRDGWSRQGHAGGQGGPTNRARVTKVTKVTIFQGPPGKKLTGRSRPDGIGRNSSRPSPEDRHLLHHLTITRAKHHISVPRTCLDGDAEVRPVLSQRASLL